jgi:deoxycytidylate deaminase
MCAKQTTFAIIISPSNEIFYGYNECLSPQIECPRELEGCVSGEGYELCKLICRQTGHAEENACKSAGYKAINSDLYLFGHTYCCENCIKVMKEYGVKRVFIINDNQMKLAYKFGE